MRERIMEVHRDASLSMEEKSRRIQSIMSGKALEEPAPAPQSEQTPLTYHVTVHVQTREANSGAERGRAGLHALSSCSVVQIVLLWQILRMQILP